MTQVQILQTIRARRQLLKITQIDLAELSGISLRTLKAIENGSANPTLESTLRILTVLGLTIEILNRRPDE